MRLKVPIIAALLVYLPAFGAMADGIYIQQSTANQNIILGPIVSATDHRTNLTGASLTVTLSKNAGSFGSPAGAVTEIGKGRYSIAANATDSNTLATLSVDVVASLVTPTTAPTVTTATTGGSIAAGTYLCSYSWTTDAGETAVSSSGTITTTGATSTVTITAPTSLPVGATGMNVYISTAGGGTGTEIRGGFSGSNVLTLTVLPSGTASAPSSNTAVASDPWGKDYQIVAFNPLSATSMVTGINGLAPPPNWNLANIDASGRVLLQPTQTGVTIPNVTTLTTNNDKTGYALTVAPLTATQTADAVWQALTATYAGAGSVGLALANAASSAATAATSAAAIKLVTDVFQFDGSSYVKSSAQTLPSPAPTGYGGSGGGGASVSVSISNPASSIYDGNSRVYRATVVGGASGVTWSTDHGSISPTTGEYTAPSTGSGTSTITATSVDDPTKSAESTIAYSPGPSVTLNRSNQSVSHGASLSIAATVVNSTSTVIWSITPSTPARLVTSGNSATFYAPTSNGTFVIRATIPNTGKSASVTLSVP